jgi:hypothetical protein
MSDTDFATSNDAGQGAIDRSTWTITSTCRRCRAAWNLAPQRHRHRQDGKAFLRRQPETEPELERHEVCSEAAYERCAGGQWPPRPIDLSVTQAT